MSHSVKILLVLDVPGQMTPGAVELGQEQRGVMTMGVGAIMKISNQKDVGRIMILIHVMMYLDVPGNQINGVNRYAM